MKDTTTAIYHGKEYSAGIKIDGRIVLRSDDSRDEVEGFELKQIGNNRKYIKYVVRDEIEELYKKNLIATYKGYDFWIISEEESKILISATNMDYRICLELGMQCIDKGIYQMWIEKNEAEIRVEKEAL